MNPPGAAGTGPGAQETGRGETRGETRGGAGTRPGLRRWHAELAWLPGHGVRPRVLIEASGERFSAVTPDVAAGDLPAGTVALAGLTLPGLANAHSHAFHRALRGVGQAGQGTFWTWRERMYQVAQRLDPGRYLALARAVYAEMALAGVACVGEFHYLHHGPGGAPYADPNEMGRMLIEAAAQAGIRITLLDTCYLSGGLTADGTAEPLSGAQLRFSDGDGDRWAQRASALGPRQHGTLGAHARAGVAIHSVRAVPPGQMQPMIARAPRVRAAVWPARPTSPGGTWKCSAAAAPPSASARPPRLTWPTGSGRPQPWPRRAARSRWAVTATPSSTCWRRRAGSNSANGWPPAGAGISAPTRWPPRPPRPGTPAWAGRTRGISRRVRWPTW